VGIDADWPALLAYKKWCSTSYIYLHVICGRPITDHKVVHHPTPSPAGTAMDHLYLHDESDVDYALKILGRP